MSPVQPTGDADAVVDQLRRWLDQDDDGPAGGPGSELVVETSGSSGRPKRVVLRRGAVLASVHATAARLGATGRWVLALPPGFVAGVQVVCRSLLAGHAPLLLERDGWPPEGPGEEPWFTSVVPTQLLRLLDDPAATAALARAHTVLLGGGPADPALRERAAAAGIRTVSTYGSAETAGGCVYDGRPLDGVEVALGPGGRVEIGGPTLFSRYDGDPGLTADVLVDGRFLTSDAGRFTDDGRLQVLGRLDDVVVTGGVNVPAPAVAARLREHPDVAAAEALGVPDVEWGHRVVAFVVAREGARPPGLADVRDWVGQRHPRTWSPRQLVPLDAVPLLPNGKPDRLRLRALAAGSASGEASS